MIDVHCHLNFHAFEKDYDELIHEAKREGVNKIINVGTKLDSSAKAVALAQQYDDLYAIVGVHPHHADKQELRSMNYELRENAQGEIKFSSELIAPSKSMHEKNASARGSEENFHFNLNADDNWIKQLEYLARQPKVVGIGEIGMDYYRYQSNGIVNPTLQKEIFEAQIELAHRLGLPIQIHNRHAGKDVLEILNHHKNLLNSDNPGMFHCFAGDMDILKGALELGFYIGFDGNITYPGLAPGETTSLSDLAKATPMDRIVTETDSPFLTPIPHRGSRNNPSRVILVGAFLAKVKGITEEEIDRQTQLNAKQLFGIQ